MSQLEYLYQEQNDNRWCEYIHNQTYGNVLKIFDTKYATIVKLYILPHYWLMQSSDKFSFSFDPDDGSYALFPDSGSVSTDYKGFAFAPLDIANNDFIIYQRTITKDVRNVSVGFYTSQLKYDYIGRDTDIRILASINYDEFGLFLCYNGIKTEITDLFEFKQDYDVVSSETIAQREIARKIDTVSGITGAIQGIAQVGLGVAQMGAGLPTIPYTTAESPLDMFGIPIPQTMHKSPTQIAGGVGNISGGVSKMVNGIMKTWSANADKYAPVINQHNYSMAIINAQYGFIVLKVANSNILNYAEIYDAVRNIGYNVRIGTNNLDVMGTYNYTTHKPSNLLEDTILEDTTSITTIDNYNVVQFDFVRLVGLSGEICKTISNILTNGVKIWYTHLIT